MNNLLKNAVNRPKMREKEGGMRDEKWISMKLGDGLTLKRGYGLDSLR